MKIFTIFISISILSLAALISSEEELLPTFSLKSGFYNRESIVLEISIEDSEAVIYFTLDSSEPTINSTIYKNPLVFKDKSLEENVYSNIKNVTADRDHVPKEKIKKANVVRAMAKLSNGTFTPVITRTYFVGLNRKELYGDAPILSIVTDPKNLFDYEKGIYMLGKMYDDWIQEDPENKEKPSYSKKGNYNLKGRESERPASIEYFPVDEKKEGFSQNGGIRIAGAVSRAFIQKSFRVFFRKEYGKKNLKYELIPGNIRSDGQGVVNKYKTFTIRNGGNDFEYTKIRDKTLQDLIINRKLETQQSEVIVLFLEGEYWGVYILVENYDEHYISYNYDIEDNNVIIIKNSKIEAGENTDDNIFEKMSQYVSNEDMSGPSKYKQASELLDIENFMWYAVFNIYIGNRDSVFKANNWAMWSVRNPVQNITNADGKWRAMVFDNDLSAGLFVDENDYNNIMLSDIFNETLTMHKCIGTRFLNSLLKNLTFKNMFINALCDIRNIDFESNRVFEYLEKLNFIIEPLMVDNFLRFGPHWVLNNPQEYYQNQVSTFKNWLYLRYNTFVYNIAKYFNFQPPVEVSVTSINFSKGTFIVNNGWKIFEEEYKGLYFTENVLHLSANPTKGIFEYWRVKNCKLIDSDETSFKSESINLSINPLEGCSVTAYYK